MARQGGGKILTSRPAITVRELTPSDMPTAVHLLRLRDDRHHESDSVAGVLRGLDPAQLRAWGAFVDGEPAGLTTFYVRRLSDWAGEEVVAGYWGHLFVRPEFRKLMIYPLLIRAMRQGKDGAQCRVIFTATRQPRVAEGHQRLGFELIGRLAVRFKPLRPFRLVAKQRHLGRIVENLSALGDGLYVPLLRLVGKRRLAAAAHREIDLGSDDVESVVGLMNEARRGGIGQVWSAESFRRRFAMTIDSSHYTVLGYFAGEGLEAVLIFCTTTRGETVRTGVLIEMASRPGREDAAVSLLSEAESRMMDAGCEVVLHVDGMGSDREKLMPRLGYRTAPHLYHLLVWSPDDGWKKDARSELSSWRFAFSDHDAF